MVSRYTIQENNCRDCHELTTELDEWIKRSELAAEEALKLKRKGGLQM